MKDMSDKDRYHWYQNAQNLFWKSPIWEVDLGYDESWNNALLEEIYDIGRNITLGIDAKPSNSIWDYAHKYPHLNEIKQKIIDAGQYKGNNHPTVKPVELMKYLIKLITPAGGTVLDPYNGSGSTGMAAVELGHPYIGCELDPKYVEISTKRIEAWYRECNPTTFGDLFDTK